MWVVIGRPPSFLLFFSFGSILENPYDSYDEVYYMNPCIAQDPLVASGEELKEHKATKSWIKMGIYLP